MKTYGFSIQKGGTGKTTISTNIAYFFSSQGKKTILIDIDPQGNATASFQKNDPKFDIGDLLFERCGLSDCIMNVRENLDIIPVNNLSGDLKLYGETKLFQDQYVFIEIIQELEKRGYQYCVVDMSPGLSQLEKSMLIACNEIITPILPEAYSLDGVGIFKNSISKIEKAMREVIHHKKIVVNNFNASFKLHKENLEEMKGFSNEYDFFVVPQDTNFKKSQNEYKSIFEYVEDSRAFDSIKELGGALL